MQRCVGDVYHLKGLGHDVNMKGMMGCSLVKLMQATIILAFSLLLKPQYILYNVFQWNFMRYTVSKVRPAFISVSSFMNI